ncbi:MAG: glycosyltransferase family 4 protein [Fimbriimonadaceae bacterium]|nr:glycosyltransferase family 4 protein [Fimbriimonadaceae bacterium]
MKILLLSTGFLEYMICLANALGSEAEVSLMLPERGLTPQYRKLITSHVRLLPFQYVDYKSVRQNFRMLLDLARTILREKPDVLHIQSNGFRLFWLLYPLLRRISIVDTVHDPSPHSGDLLSAPEPRAQRGAIKHCRAFFVHGEALREDLVKHYRVRPSAIHVIPLGEFSLYRHWRKETVPTRRYEFLFFGRIWPYKGLDGFIAAANQVAKAMPSARFTIAGAGEDIKKYERMIESPERFEIRNYRIPEEEIDELFQRCFAVVLPYSDATQSAVIPTAYAYGKPVIATRVGALPEVVREGKTGYLVDAKDPAAISQKMLQMSSDEYTYKALCAGALAFAHEQLSWGVVARRSMDVYRTVLAGSTRGDAWPLLSQKAGRRSPKTHRG